MSEGMALPLCRELEPRAKVKINHSDVVPTWQACSSPRRSDRLPLINDQRVTRITGPELLEPSFEPVIKSLHFGRLELNNKIVSSDVIFSLQTSIPNSTQGCLFATQEQGTGLFVGVVVDGGLFFRAVLFANQSPVADLKIALPDPRIPTDGQTHAVAWAISLSGSSMKLYFDGHERFNASWSPTLTRWSGGNPPVAAFGVGNTYIPIIDSTAGWPDSGFIPPLNIWVRLDTPTPTYSPYHTTSRAECKLEPNCPIEYAFQTKGAVQDSCDVNPTGNFWRCNSSMMCTCNPEAGTDQSCLVDEDGTELVPVSVLMLVPLGIDPAVIGGALLAIDDINGDPSVLSSHLLVPRVVSSVCRTQSAIEELVKSASWLTPQGRPLGTLLGPACDDACAATAHVMSALGLMQVSAMCVDDKLSNRVEFPTFVRTTTPYSKWGLALVAVFNNNVWKHAATITSSEPRFTSAEQAYHDKFKKANIQLTARITFAPGRVDDEMTRGRIKGISKQSTRIVLVLVPLLSIPISSGVSQFEHVCAFPQGSSSDALQILGLATEFSMFRPGWAWIGIDSVQYSTGCTASLLLARSLAHL
jgi:hypothetical protein